MKRTHDRQFAAALGVGGNSYEDHRDSTPLSAVTASLGELVAKRIGVDPAVATQVIGGLSDFVEAEAVTGVDARNLQNLAYFVGSLVNSIDRGVERRTLPSAREVA